MSASPHTAASLLRASLFVLLVLGALVRPTLDLLGNLHGAEHATAADHGHSLADDLKDPAGADHAKVLHQLFHHADTHAAASLWNELHWGATPSPASVSLRLDVRWRPSQQASSPFRPPIA